MHGNTAETCKFDHVLTLEQVQRNLCYSTQDIRDAYQLIKEELLNEKHQKVVFILHSQGGIEGGLVIDWLLDEIPQDRMQRLEVYTFGNAANHFNNPHRLLASTNKVMQLDVRAAKQSKAIRYVEHYANSGMTFILPVARLADPPQVTLLLNLEY